MAGTKRKRFQLTSLSKEDKERLAGLIKNLGGTFIDTQIFSKQVTHVICGKPNRGEKYLGGCALGKWVLQKEYLEDSFKNGSWLAEEIYEWTSDVLDTGSPTQLTSLYEAPRQWRLEFQSKGGAFKSWNAIVLVQDSKMKKAYERLLEAGDATVLNKKKIFSSQDSILPKDLTHIFVDNKLKCDVLHLECKGILVCSPDFIPEYIIQCPKEAVTSRTTLKYNNLMNTHKIPTISGNKENPGVLLGKENGSVVEMKSKGHAGKKGGVKRLAADCGLCVAKRQKTMVIENNLPPHHYINSTQHVQKAGHLAFPGYVSNILESCVDEGCLDLGMESVTSSLSSSQAPTSKWLHMIMNQFLLNAPNEKQAFQSYHLLQNILEVHPPASCQSLYLEAMVECSGDSQNSQSSHRPTSWDFLSKVIRSALEDDEESTDTSRMQSNAGLLLKFLDSLFKFDGCRTEQSIITRILWPTSSNSMCQSNVHIKEFVALCCDSVRMAVSDDSKLFVCHVLLDLLSMAATLKKRDDVTGQACESLAHQLFQEISKTENYEVTKLILQGCHSSWLKIKMLELILENFDKRLIPQEYKHLLNKTLKLNKIVLCYFFLLPNMRGVQKTNLNAKGKPTIAKRNGKGETPLHLACIHDDATKVEEILKQKDVDVNTTDNAGWTALHEACNHGHVQCVKKILQYHEKTNRVNLLACPDDGVTVLHDAVLNNHLPVVKLLTKAGGVDLLEAKTSSGMTALQLARTNEIAKFLQSELNKLQSTGALNQEYLYQPSPGAYSKILSKNKRKQYVPMQDCEKYLFYVSQFVQVYIREHLLPSDDNTFSSNSNKFCTNCEVDVECCSSFLQHLAKLEQHVKSLSGRQNLSQLCQLYLTLMKLCISCVWLEGNSTQRGKETEMERLSYKPCHEPRT